MICFWCFHQNDCNSQNWKARLRKSVHDETQDNYNKFEIIIVINILVHAHDWLNWYWKQSNVLFSPTINIYKKKQWVLLQWLLHSSQARIILVRSDYLLFDAIQRRYLHGVTMPIICCPTCIILHISIY